MKRTFFGNRIFADVVKLRQGHVELVSYDLYKKRGFWTQRNTESTPCEDGDRVWGDVARSQGPDAKDGCEPPEARSPAPLRGHHPAPPPLLVPTPSPAVPGGHLPLTRSPCTSVDASPPSTDTEAETPYCPHSTSM